MGKKWGLLCGLLLACLLLAGVAGAADIIITGGNPGDYTLAGDVLTFTSTANGDTFTLTEVGPGGGGVTVNRIIVATSLSSLTLRLEGGTYTSPIYSAFLYDSPGSGTITLIPAVSPVTFIAGTTTHSAMLQNGGSGRLVIDGSAGGAIIAQSHQSNSQVMGSGITAGNLTVRNGARVLPSGYGSGIFGGTVTVESGGVIELMGSLNNRYDLNITRLVITSGGQVTGGSSSALVGVRCNAVTIQDSGSLLGMANASPGYVALEATLLSLHDGGLAVLSAAGGISHRPNIASNTAQVRFRGTLGGTLETVTGGPLTMNLQNQATQPSVFDLSGGVALASGAVADAQVTVAFTPGTGSIVKLMPAGSTPTLADPALNTVTAPTQAQVGQEITLTAYGHRQGATGVVDGDTLYVPTEAWIPDTGVLTFPTGGPYSLQVRLDTPGTHTLAVIYHLYQYDSVNGWVDTGLLERKDAVVTVAGSSPTQAPPSPTASLAPGATPEPVPATGDDGHLWLYVFAFLACGVLLWLSRGRRIQGR